MERKFSCYRQLIDGQLKDRTAIDQRRYDDYIAGRRDGCYKETIEKAVKSKSNQQVKAVWGLMIRQTIEQADDLGIDISAFLKYLLSECEPKGVGLYPEFLHELMYLLCPTTNEDGSRITLSRMSTVQAANLFERFRAIVAPLGIVIPDPNPNWRDET
jgi:hypothetical protein